MFFESVTDWLMLILCGNIVMIPQQIPVKYNVAQTDLEATSFGTEDPSPFSWGAGLCASKASPSVRRHS